MVAVLLDEQQSAGLVAPKCGGEELRGCLELPGLLRGHLRLRGQNDKPDAVRRVSAM